MEIDAIDGNDGHIYCIKKIDEIQETLIDIFISDRHTHRHTQT